MLTEKQTPQMKVGDVVYLKTEKGYLYAEFLVLGETSRSWIVMRPKDAEIGWQRNDLNRYGTKVPKNLKGWALGTKMGAELARWALSERHYIGTAVSGQEPERLLEIAKMIGYRTLPEEEK